MGLCKDCKKWKIMNVFASTIGRCMRLSFNNAGVMDAHGYIKDDSPNILTRPSFGCVHYEEKERGPFRIKGGHGVISDCWYAIEYLCPDGTVRDIGWKKSVDSALDTASWLNKLWERGCTIRKE